MSLEILSDYLNIFLNNILYEVISFGTISGIVIYLYKVRPKVENEELMYDYIDDYSNMKWIQKKYIINWGKLPLNKIRLCETNILNDIELYSLPQESVQSPLILKTHYEEDIKDKTKIIYLIDKEFYKVNKINEIIFISKQYIPKSYRDNLHPDLSDNDVLIIKNANLTPIKNYVLKLDKKECLDIITKNSDKVDQLIFNITNINYEKNKDKKLNELQLNQVTINVIVNEIPARIAGTDGKVTLTKN